MEAEKKAKWKKTNFSGVRYYEHESRLHGVIPDKYFAIRFQTGGKRREEGIGWASKGWTAEKAAVELAKLKNAARIGEGPIRLSEKREIEQERRDKKEREAVTFGDYFNKTYYPSAETSKKSYQKEKQHFDTWIEPVLGKIPIKDIKPIAIERLKKKMLDAGRAWRTIEYVLATVRQVWNSAKRAGLVQAETPTKGVKIARTDNRRLRFLTHEEADALLEALKKRDFDAYCMALVSLHAGLRASEIFRLTWGDIDVDRGRITVRDAKAGSRTAFMTATLRDLFSKLKRLRRSELVFKGPISGEQFTEIPGTFFQAVDDCNLNQGVRDRRDRVVFHTCRHTYASWLAESGVSLIAIKELMGHKTLAMVQRYAHLGDDALEKAVGTMEARMNHAGKEVSEVPAEGGNTI